MSRIKIFMNPLDAKSVIDYEVKPGTRIIDWLKEYYPTGFDGSLRVFLTGHELQLDDLDKTIGQNDQVVMLVMPTGDPVSLAVTAIVSAVVGAAVGYVINLIFPPETPKGLKNENISPTYDISATRNRARLNEPIAVHYGEVVYPPDFASPPYNYYQGSSDAEYVDQLMCLGSGDYEILDVFIGGTPVNNLRPGTVTQLIYTPSEHGQVLGFIADDVTTKAQGTENPFPFSEYVYTAPEVSQIEITDSTSDAVGTPQPFVNGSAFAGEIEPPNTFNGFINGIPDTFFVRVNDVITVTGTALNNIEFRVGSVTNLGDGRLRVFEQDFGTISNEVPLPETARFQINNVTTDMRAGPFRPQARGAQINRIDLDIAFPGGLSTILANGNRDFKTINFRASIAEIDDAGNIIGIPFDETFSITGKQRDTKRDTISIDVPPGQYQVVLIRETPYNDTRFDLERSVWVRLKGNVVLDTSQPAYGNVTMMAIRLKASQGISQEGQQQIRVRARRLLPGGVSSNPITAIKDIFTNTDYGLGRDINEMELTQLDRLETEWGGATGPKFNGSFDVKSTAFEAMNSVASLAAAKVLQHNALTTVIADEVQPVRTAVFSTGNIVKDSLTVDYTFDVDSDYDGYVLEYRSQFWNPRRVTYPETAVNPEAITLFGSTDEEYTRRFATYLWNVRNQRRKVATFETELEGLIPRFGDRIGIGHPMPNWGASGVVVEVIDATTVRVDAALDWTTISPVVIFRDDKGLPHGPYDVTEGATSDIMVLSGAPTETVYGPIGQEPSSYLFGSQTEVIKDFIVTRVSPRGEQSVTIEAQVYDETIYNGGPPHMGGSDPLVLDQSPFWSFKLTSGQSPTVSNNIGFNRDDSGPATDPDNQSYGTVDDIAVQDPITPENLIPVPVPGKPWELWLFGQFDLTPPPYEWVNWMPGFRSTDSNPIPDTDESWCYWEIFSEPPGFPDYPVEFDGFEYYLRREFNTYDTSFPNEYRWGNTVSSGSSGFPIAIDDVGETGRIQMWDSALEEFDYGGLSAPDPDNGQNILGYRKGVMGNWVGISAGGWEIHGVYYNTVVNVLRIEIVDETRILPVNAFARVMWSTSDGRNNQLYQPDDPRPGRVTRSYRVDSQTGQTVSVWEWASGLASPGGLAGGGQVYFLGLPQ